MARRIANNGSLIVDGLKDLKRGDKVYITQWGYKYIPTIIKRVRTVECATIITVEKREEFSNVRFVGYHLAKTAEGDKECVLTVYNYWADRAEKLLKEAEEGSKTIAKRADALIALHTLKNWLFHKENDCELFVE